MTFKIAIASGKGGTGKTTVSVNLYHFFLKYISEKVKLVDCDVEEPNDVLFFKETEMESTQKVMQFIPEIDPEKCTYCNQCVDYCEFNAISVIPSVKYTDINADLCHSCGACLVACTFGAITEKAHMIGTINNYKTGNGDGLTEGILRVGSPMQTMVIKELKKKVFQNEEIIIYDAPPGTSCPVVQTVADADFTILVTEPTPFGLHDLKLAVDLLKETGIPFGIIVNKAGLGNKQVYEYIKSERLELLGSIPFNKNYAAQYSSGNILSNIPDEIEICYLEIIKKLKRKIVRA
jgi:MinD superfamily P-loop ATPase